MTPSHKSPKSTLLGIPDAEKRPPFWPEPVEELQKKPWILVRVIIYWICWPFCWCCCWWWRRETIDGELAVDNTGKAYLDDGTTTADVYHVILDYRSNKARPLKARVLERFPEQETGFGDVEVVFGYFTSIPGPSDPFPTMVEVTSPTPILDVRFATEIPIKSGMSVTSPASVVWAAKVTVEYGSTFVGELQLDVIRKS
jgi:hypothetical protein